MIKDIYNKLKYHPKRLLHVIEVSNTCMILAKHYNLNILDAKLMGLIHDYSKYETNDFYKLYVNSYHFNKYNKDTYMYHAISAANYFRRHYNINNNIYNAVFYHVTGKPDMDIYTKILFIADSVYLNGKNNTRDLLKLAYTNLDSAVLRAIEINLMKLEKKGLEISKYQLETLEYYIEV